MDLINEILATLSHNKLRTALTGFAVSWGIFLLVVLLSISRGLLNAAEDMFSQNDTETMTINGGWAQKPYHGLKEDREIALKKQDLQLLANRNADIVRGVAAEIDEGSATVSTSRDYVTQGYRGAYPSALRSDGGKLDRGRFINETALREGRRVIVLHKDHVATLFGDKDPIGRQVELKDRSFTVVGVYTHQWNRTNFIPYTTARALAGNSDTIRRMLVSLKNVHTIEDGDKAEESFRRTLGAAHSFAPDDRNALWVWNRLNQHLRMTSAMGMLELAVWIIGLLTMLSGIVGVSNIMFVSVRERTHEIGIRRAIGARPLSILRQIMFESVAITTLFGYIGIVLGIMVASAIGAMVPDSEPRMLLDPSISIGMALELTVVLIAAGALAGLFPAIKSLKIKPVEALRDE